MERDGDDAAQLAFGYKTDSPYTTDAFTIRSVRDMAIHEMGHVQHVSSDGYMRNWEGNFSLGHDQRRPHHGSSGSADASAGNSD